MIVIGFGLGLNPMLVVTLAAFASAMAAGYGPLAVVSMIGHGFVENRLLSLPLLALAMVGLLERAGLREQARKLIGRMRGATSARILLFYLVFREISAALGLRGVGGHVQMVRPIVAPMTEAAQPGADEQTRRLLRAHAAAVDNIGSFFGEDVFVAVGSVLLIRAVLAQHGIDVAPLHVAFWALPTAIAALLIHGARLLLLGRRLRRGKAS
ncbi:DUF969 domain-containing protein [Acetobacteraceae bacterium KSS8]|uniref:DUF969 domain-containing protein n=1 Tax=Endosaccharibacter trunci TaxID=2812733 RepID=A0ABT1W584_9PROT|nr:DUF969 domain-containing protein [Acetobacteraceae bacterium KSS8]